MRVDHVIIAARDLNEAAARLRAEHELEATGGGRHDGVGTENRIVPLGDGYLELLAFADPGEAASSPLGRALSARIEANDGRPIGWAVEVDDVRPVAERLGTPIEAISREGLTASLTATAEAMAKPLLPFFIARDHEIADPGAGSDLGGIEWVEVSGDPGRLEEWLGGAELPVRFVDGEPGLRAVGVAGRRIGQ